MGAVTVIDGAGNEESAWDACSWLWERAPTPLRTLLGSSRQLVVVAPHPDDEVLGCGGLMLQAALDGCEVTVVAVTDGEACYPDDPRWTPAQLREVRRAELHEALSVLGLRDAKVVHLGIADGSVSDRKKGLAARLLTLIPAGAVVLAPWHRDGHPDHEACAAAARHAARKAGATVLEYPVWGWHWLDPTAAQVAWPDPLLLDISAQRVAKQQAIACFRSQTGADDPLTTAPILPPNVLQRFARPHEVFLR